MPCRTARQYSIEDSVGTAYSDDFGGSTARSGSIAEESGQLRSVRSGSASIADEHGQTYSRSTDYTSVHEDSAPHSRYLWLILCAILGSLIHYEYFLVFGYVACCAALY